MYSRLFSSDKDAILLFNKYKYRNVRMASDFGDDWVYIGSNNISHLNYTQLEKASKRFIVQKCHDAILSYNK